jgi:heme/copper-type cytochrome/quinol oxidase subunit 2
MISDEHIITVIVASQQHESNHTHMDHTHVYHESDTPIDTMTTAIIIFVIIFTISMYALVHKPRRDALLPTHVERSS